ncbi:hypothetical protein IVB14_24745 [Bradyrhizobium sp. 180]|uniref:hypothetical protein n=1 Tax=unclassified Bradyrhizobium TaxID=2631580 RepID=UPI001FF8D5C7|nr:MULTISPECIES: hypothetical protein [unclassified Bradyrhizobium]MCK1424299.1 hypothetical protein [Bradyrhizobium sp. CW12]MCK1493533.1 hypothetical protein [Bradyrhizobium sp. 180]MCK1528495.1 hypothetical protein [Bradyrhizobium sp. 182]MCK1599283.1 hypothetical protein [Bradyrhizobium sp. 164]MCK1649819.1 hypothetical protein [Bradyrhizobium sp. 154]
MEEKKVFSGISPFFFSLIITFYFNWGHPHVFGGSRGHVRTATTTALAGIAVPKFGRKGPILLKKAAVATQG